MLFLAERALWLLVEEGALLLLGEGVTLVLDKSMFISKSVKVISNFVHITKYYFLLNASLGGG